MILPGVILIFRHINFSFNPKYIEINWTKFSFGTYKNFVTFVSNQINLEFIIIIA